MNSDDVKNIVRKFYVLLRRNLQPLELVTEIDGLTEFDVQQIKATTRNDGDLLGSDKLLDALQRRSTRAFVSFLFLLQQRNPDIAEQILEFVKSNFSKIYQSYEKYSHSGHDNHKPSVMVRPLGMDIQPSTPVVYESHTVREQTAVTQRLQQTIITRDQESRDTFSRPGGVTVQAVHRTTEIRQVTFTEDTLLDEVPNVVFEKWASALNEENGWQKLAKVLPLSRKEVKDFKSKDNPGEEILDWMSSDYTVRALLHYLESAELGNVHREVKDLLGVPLVSGKIGRNEPMSPETNQLDKSTDNSSLVNEGSSRLQNPNIKEQTSPVQGSSSCSQSEDSPLQQLHRSSQSYDSIVNNEEMVGTEEVILGPEGGYNKNLVNNLTTYKIDNVKNLHIHVGSDPTKGANSGEEKVQNTQSASSPCLSRETSAESNPSPLAGRDETGDPVQDNVFRTNSEDEENGGNLSVELVPPDSLGCSSERQHRSLPVEDSPERSLPDSSERMIVQPEDSGDTNYEKNINQDVEALGRDLQNQINLESFRDIQNSIPENSASIHAGLPTGGNSRIYSGSYRDIQNSIPGTSSTPTGVESRPSSNGLNRIQAVQSELAPIGHPGRIQTIQSDASLGHAGKNTEQELSALQSDTRQEINRQSQNSQNNKENQ